MFERIRIAHDDHGATFNVEIPSNKWKSVVLKVWTMHEAPAHGNRLRHDTWIYKAPSRCNDSIQVLSKSKDSANESAQ